MTGRCEISFQFWPPKDSINHLTRKDQNMICRLWKPTHSRHLNGQQPQLRPECLFRIYPYEATIHQNICSVYILTRLSYTSSLSDQKTPASIKADTRSTLFGTQKRNTCMYYWMGLGHAQTSLGQQHQDAKICLLMLPTGHHPHSLTATISQPPPSLSHCHDISAIFSPL